MGSVAGCHWPCQCVLCEQLAASALHRPVRVESSREPIVRTWRTNVAYRRFCACSPFPSLFVLTSPSNSTSADCTIVGASFARLACATVLARRGLRVRVLQRKDDPSDKLRTTGIIVNEVVDQIVLFDLMPLHLVRYHTMISRTIDAWRRWCPAVISLLNHRSSLANPQFLATRQNSIPPLPPPQASSSNIQHFGEVDKLCADRLPPQCYEVAKSLFVNMYTIRYDVPTHRAQASAL